jgi:hypothetical protein
VEHRLASDHHAFQDRILRRSHRCCQRNFHPQLRLLQHIGTDHILDRYHSFQHVEPPNPNRYHLALLMQASHQTLGIRGSPYQRNQYVEIHNIYSSFFVFTFSADRVCLVVLVWLPAFLLEASTANGLRGFMCEQSC